VAEYGNHRALGQNYLKLNSAAAGAARGVCDVRGACEFGGTLDVDDAMALDFDHIALCMARASRPCWTYPMGWRAACGPHRIPDGAAADRAAKADSIANMRAAAAGGDHRRRADRHRRGHRVARLLRGAGRKFLTGSRTGGRIGEGAVRERWMTWTRNRRGFLAHARALREERALARRDNRPARIAELLREWAGPASPTGVA